MAKSTIEITFKPIDTSNNLTTVLKNCVDTVHFGLRMIENSENLPKRLDEEDDFLHFQIGQIPNEKDQQIIFKKWLLAKGFEDLMKGINLTLIDAYVLVVFRRILISGEIKNERDLLNKQSELKIKAQEYGIPTLITKLTDYLTQELKFTDCILSINKARNCFIHRNGIIDPDKDINNKEENNLEISWVKYLFTVDKNGAYEELKEGTRVIGKTSVHDILLKKRYLFVHLKKLTCLTNNTWK